MPETRRQKILIKNLDQSKIVAIFPYSVIWRFVEIISLYIYYIYQCIYLCI